MKRKKANKPPYKATSKNPVSTGTTIKKKQVVGKIGYCDNATLGIKDKDGKPIKGGHYVYIREMNGTTKCNVNVVTSLESYVYVYDRKTKRKVRVLDRTGKPVTSYDGDKLNKVKNGRLYPVPKVDAGFPLWSALNLDNNINGVKVSDIKDIGKVKMKRRHKFFVGKYSGDYT